MSGRLLREAFHPTREGATVQGPSTGKKKTEGHGRGIPLEPGSPLGSPGSQDPLWGSLWRQDALWDLLGARIPLWSHPGSRDPRKSWGSRPDKRYKGPLLTAGHLVAPGIPPRASVRNGALYLLSGCDPQDFPGSRDPLGSLGSQDLLWIPLEPGFALDPFGARIGFGSLRSQDLLWIPSEPGFALLLALLRIKAFAPVVA